MEISVDALKEINLTELEPYAMGLGDLKFTAPAGISHYPLLAHISTLYNNSKFIDLGTYYGWSALSLAKNNSNKVITYDLTDHITAFNVKNKKIHKSILNLKNIIFKQKNILNDLDEIKDSSIIFLSVDPSDGIQERIIFKSIKECGFKGILIIDNIKLNLGMRNFWDNIDLFKRDLTYLGHYTGTGFVYFNDNFIND